MDTSPAARRDDRGFTLVELLIVIVVLGVLATITVFAVRGITNEGQQSACASDKKSIETAEESNMAQHGAYVAESALVTNGLLREESSNVDVTVGTDTAGKPTYAVSNVGDCAGGSAPTTAAPGPTTPVPSGLFPTFTRTITGTGTPIVVIVGYGSGNLVAQAWKAALSRFPTGPTTARYVIMDTTGDAAIDTAHLDAIISGADKVIWVVGTDVIIGGARTGLIAQFELSDALPLDSFHSRVDSVGIDDALAGWGLDH